MTNSIFRNLWSTNSFILLALVVKEVELKVHLHVGAEISAVDMQEQLRMWQNLYL